MVGQDHALARRAVVPTLATLGEIDLVAYRVCRANAEVERHLSSHGVQPRIVFRAEDNHLLQGLAAQGVGAAIMPLLAIDQHRDDIVTIGLADLIPDRRIGLVRHRDRYETPAAKAFSDLAGETASQVAREFDLEVAAG